MRIVSLVPSVTESLLAWGVRPVAVTRFCERPELPQVGGTKNPDVRAIVELAPDLVVMNEEENRREDAEALRASGVAVHVVRVGSVHDVEPAMEELAVLVGGPRVVRVELGASRPARLRAFVPIWRRPWMTIGRDSYGASVIRHLGVGNVFDDRDRYPEVSLDEVAERAPDVVLAPSEPYPFGERHRGELEALAPVLFVDGRDLFWWGTRTADALARLERQLRGFAGPTR
ncbi:MAG: helical backbone metal receptor [Acidimicrobiales bacterium]